MRTLGAENPEETSRWRLHRGVVTPNRCQLDVFASSGRRGGAPSHWFRSVNTQLVLALLLL
jgi:hypothetical protein